ncbi:uncharacterized protein EV154DRAFT_485627 [Mucor mucedo]|uniref:uncharacterized protein n=1 Tax=Mucor mucedo TaxID=29922 RepID=UPI00221EC778|nr:uncharacterized protein EV154DRAFT_485627 [Mucor mucedo]KAI7882298.1 hypothetical protein EV154DRAFT_485627 [Mucor mucedo]
MDISGAKASNNIKHNCMLFTAACYEHPPSKHGIIQIKVSQWTLEISLKLRQKRSTMKRHASVYTDTNTVDDYILKTVIFLLYFKTSNSIVAKISVKVSNESCSSNTNEEELSVAIKRLELDQAALVLEKY